MGLKVLGSVSDRYNALVVLYRLTEGTIENDERIQNRKKKKWIHRNIGKKERHVRVRIT